MTLTKEGRLAAIQQNMDAKQEAIILIDRKIKRTDKSIEERKQRKINTEALENQLAGFLSSREYMRVQWQKMMDEVKALSETDSDKKQGEQNEVAEG